MPEDNIDIEAIQAQIDLSNSVAYDLVSSWMKPSTSRSPSLVSQQISRELEEFAKRPSRLGLGATLSKSNIATIREAARLKGKLTGKKRLREEGGNDALGSGGADDADSEDEKESRSAAISMKKPQRNGVFGSGNRKGKARAADVLEAKSSLDPHMGKQKKIEKNQDPPDDEVDDAGPPRSSTHKNQFAIPKPPSPPSISTKNTTTILDIPPSSDAHSPSPSKKRRKRHKKSRDHVANADTSLLDEEWTGFEANALVGIEVDVHSNAVVQEKSQLSNSKLTQESSTMNLTPPTKIVPSGLPSKTVPLLNLETPILSPDVESIPQMVNASPSKKRRHRRRKGKSRQIEGNTVT